MRKLQEETDNRKLILLNAIHELGTFTESELLEQFKKLSNGKESVGFGQTIHGLLRELTDVGALKYEDYRYEVREPALDQKT